MLTKQQIEVARCFKAQGMGLKEAVEAARRVTARSALRKHQPKGLRPKQRVTTVIRCPQTGVLAPHTRRVVEMAKWQPYGQGGRSFETRARFYIGCR